MKIPANITAIYDAAKAQVSTPSIDTADVAKLIRYRLRVAFPAVKFKVRIERYAGGSAVRIAWTDGPTSAMVDGITGQYEGKGFDGMIDMAYFKDHYLLPDGRGYFAQTSGTEGSMGVHPAEKNFKPVPEAIRVHFSSGYVTTSRSYSKEFLERVLQSYARKYSDALAAAIEAGLVYVRESYGRHYIDGAGSIALGGQWGDMVLNRYKARRMVAA